MYNLVFGTNQMSDAILATLGLTRDNCGRFRDCGVARGEIWVYTRNGGGNRDEYQDTLDALAEHPCYLRDEDDDFDCTYCTIYFRFPEPFANALNALDGGEAFDPSARWQQAIAAIKKGEAPEVVSRLTEALAPLFESLQAKPKA